MQTYHESMDQEKSKENKAPHVRNFEPAFPDLEYIKVNMARARSKSIDLNCNQETNMRARVKSHNRRHTIMVGALSYENQKAKEGLRLGRNSTGDPNRSTKTNSTHRRDSTGKMSTICDENRNQGKPQHFKSESMGGGVPHNSEEQKKEKAPGEGRRQEETRRKQHCRVQHCRNSTVGDKSNPNKTSKKPCRSSLRRTHPQTMPKEDAAIPTTTRTDAPSQNVNERSIDMNTDEKPASICSLDYQLSDHSICHGELSCPESNKSCHSQQLKSGLLPAELLISDDNKHCNQNGKNEGGEKDMSSTAPPEVSLSVQQQRENQRERELQLERQSAIESGKQKLIDREIALFNESCNAAITPCDSKRSVASSVSNGSNKFANASAILEAAEEISSRFLPDFKAGSVKNDETNQPGLTVPRPSQPYQGKRSWYACGCCKCWFCEGTYRYCIITLIILLLFGLAGAYLGWKFIYSSNIDAQSDMIPFEFTDLLGNATNRPTMYLRTGNPSAMPTGANFKILLGNTSNKPTMYVHSETPSSMRNPQESNLEYYPKPQLSTHNSTILTNAPSNFEQLILDVFGTSDGDKCGTSISFSSDGKRLALSSRTSVQVYNFVNASALNFNTVFTETSINRNSALSTPAVIRRSPIPNSLGNASDANFDEKYPVSLSKDGMRVALRRSTSQYSFVRVYSFHASNKNDDEKWIQIGRDISTSSSTFGSSISLSFNGEILAIGDAGYDNCKGRVHVYKYSEDENDWVELARPLDGNGGCFGWSVSLSGDGRVVAVGAPNGSVVTTVKTLHEEKNLSKGTSTQDNENAQIESDKNGYGYVGVYEYTINEDSKEHTWLQKENGWMDIAGIDPNDLFGYSLSLSFDGRNLAVGAPDYRGIGGVHRGRASVFRRVKNDGNNTRLEWELYGAFDGETDNECSGFSVSLSSDGTLLLVGSPGYDGAISSSSTGSKTASTGKKGKGIANSYHYVPSDDDDVWIKLQESIMTEGLDGDEVGYSVSLSDDGLVAIGGPMLESTRRGSVRVFKTNIKQGYNDKATASANLIFEEKSVCGRLLCHEKDQTVANPNAIVDPASNKTCMMIEEEFNRITSTELCALARLTANMAKSTCGCK